MRMDPERQSPRPVAPERLSIVEIVLTIALAAFLAFAFVRLAAANPPAGINPNGQESQWWACQAPPHAEPCCAEADGQVLDNDRWHETGIAAFPYEVSLYGKTWQVPAAAVIQPKCGAEPNKVNRWKAKIWVSPEIDGDNAIAVHIRCFLPGPGTF
jgi:hypothetical protein